jgi:hypothetical protein
MTSGVFREAGSKSQLSKNAYFDFFGASFWAVYPWTGGMKDFLKYSPMGT